MSGLHLARARNLGVEALIVASPGQTSIRSGLDALDLGSAIS